MSCFFASEIVVEIRAVTAVFMDSVITQGLWCEICDWALRPGTNLEQHNSGLVHRTLLEAVARLAPVKFQEFRDEVTLNGRKKSKFGLQRELLGATSQVSFFLIVIANFYFFKRLLPILIFLSFTLSLSTNLEGFGKNTVILQLTSLHF